MINIQVLYSDYIKGCGFYNSKNESKRMSSTSIISRFKPGENKFFRGAYSSGYSPRLRGLIAAMATNGD